MNEEMLEEKCHLLEIGLRQKLQEKHLMETRIREQLDELKKLEITLEKTKGSFPSSSYQNRE